MGWGNCGTDSKGRNIGYVFDAICDHPGCKAKIDRGLSFACGNMHGNTEFGCEGYFCEKHRSNTVQEDDGDLINICDECARYLLDSGEWKSDDDEGVIVRLKE